MFGGQSPSARRLEAATSGADQPTTGYLAGYQSAAGQDQGDPAASAPYNPQEFHHPGYSMYGMEQQWGPYFQAHLYNRSSFEDWGVPASHHFAAHQPASGYHPHTGHSGLAPGLRPENANSLSGTSSYPPASLFKTSSSPSLDCKPIFPTGEREEVDRKVSEQVTAPTHPATSGAPTTVHHSPDSGLAASEPSAGGSPPPNGGGSFTSLFSSTIHNHSYLGSSVGAGGGPGCPPPAVSGLPPPGKVEKPDSDSDRPMGGGGVGHLDGGGGTTEDDDDDSEADDGDDKLVGKHCSLNDDDDRGCSPPSTANNLGLGGSDCYMDGGGNGAGGGHQDPTAGQYIGIDGIIRPSMGSHGSGASRSPYDWMKRPMSGLDMMEGGVGGMTGTAGNNGSRPCKEGTTQFDGRTRTKDKYRVVYSDHQRLELEKEFHYSRYITIRRKAELAQVLNLSERQVKIWFQNRRAKERKQAKKRDELIHKDKLDMAAGLAVAAVQAGSAAANTNLAAAAHHHHQQMVAAAMSGFNGQYGPMGHPGTHHHHPHATSHHHHATSHHPAMLHTSLPHI